MLDDCQYEDHLGFFCRKPKTSIGVAVELLRTQYQYGVEKIDAVRHYGPDLLIPPIRLVPRSITERKRKQPHINSLFV